MYKMYNCVCGLVTDNKWTCAFQLSGVHCCGVGRTAVGTAVHLIVMSMLHGHGLDKVENTRHIHNSVVLLKQTQHTTLMKTHATLHLTRPSCVILYTHNA
jgi:hypothetical protein